MAAGKPWSYDELLIAMNLYCKLPFGQLHRGNPLVIAVAEKLGRTPSSLSMKLCNLAALDPYHQARGIKGLSGTSKGDREIWAAFNGDWEGLGVASEERLQQLLGEGGEDVPPQPATRRAQPRPYRMPTVVPAGPTETEQTTKVRLGQRFFRQSVLASYNSRCCITGNPVPELLVASHILPWSDYPEQRLNPRNGLCLAKTQDAAFDRKLITFDEDFRLVIGPRLMAYLPDAALEREFLVYEGKPLQMPDKFLPDGEFMRRHREEVMQG
jgi:hypothetical protein